MPLGLFAVRFSVANPGDTAQSWSTSPRRQTPNAKWLMYDPVNGWFDYSSHAVFSADRKSVTLELKDGGYGDADGAANGTIVDPGGFGLASWIEGFISDANTDQGIAQATVNIEDLVLNTDLNGNFLCMLLPDTYPYPYPHQAIRPSTPR